MPTNDDIIIITAARPGLWFREKLSPSALKRMLGEKFNEDYGKTMKKLRQIDDAIYEWVQDIDSLVKEVKKRRKMPGRMTDRRVIDLAILLGGLNKRFKKINQAGNILEEMNEQYLNRFEEQFKLEIPEDGSIFELGPEESRDVESLRGDPRFAADDHLFAEAGFWDDLKEKWISRKLERDTEKKRRQEISSLVQKADQMNRALKQYLKTLSKARAAGDVGQYLDTLNLISEQQQDFENNFVDVYNTYVRGPVEQYLEQQAPATTKDQPAEVLPETKDVRRQEEEGVPITVEQGPYTPPSTQAPSTIPSTQPGSIDVDLPASWDEAPPTQPTSTQPGMGPRTTMISGLDEPPSTQPTSFEMEGINSDDLDIPSDEISAGKGTYRGGPVQVSVEAKFLAAIKKVANPYQRAAMIAKFSERYEDSNPEKCIKLLTLAERIVANAER